MAKPLTRQPWQKQTRKLSPACSEPCGLGNGGEKGCIRQTERRSTALWHRDDGVEILLGHPGGPFWQNKDWDRGRFQKA